ncbi:hypothetical protein [Celeribacter sp. ULVN23_4]
MTIRDKLVLALNEAEEQVAEERHRISELIRGKDEPLARQIWDEERSQILCYYEEEVEVAESRLVLHDADTFHLPKPSYSDKHAWDVSRLSNSQYLISDERRKLRRALLEERRREDDVRSARGNQKIAIGGLIIAGIALVPAILDLLKG